MQMQNTWEKEGEWSLASPLTESVVFGGATNANTLEDYVE